MKAIVVKDFKRCIDYLETRQDIDSKKLAYYGLSWGGEYGAVIPAVEDRLRPGCAVHDEGHGLSGRKLTRVEAQLLGEGPQAVRGEHKTQG